MTWWQQLLVDLGGTVVGATGAGVIIGLIFKHWLGNKAAVFQSDLQRIATEHGVRFGGLHSKLATVIEDVYETLSSNRIALEGVRREVDRLDDLPNSLGSSSSVAHKQLVRLENLVNSKLIYFPDEVAGRLVEARDLIRLTLGNFNDGEMEHAISNETANRIVEFRHASDNLDTLIDMIQKDLTRDFHRLLGVDPALED